MTQALAIVGGLFVLVYGWLAVLAWRRPLLARLAFRESIRRRGQLVLLVVGLMIGSASITASLISSDATTQTYTAVSYQRLGGEDLSVTARDGGFFPLDVAHRLQNDAALHAYVAGVQGGVDVPASVADLDRRLGKAGVLLFGFDPTDQRSFGAYTLTDGRRVYGTELSAGDVLLSRDLARSIDARAGDQLRISLGAGGDDAVLQVYGIAAASGPGAYGSPLAIYAPLATVQGLTGEPGINVVRVAARDSTVDDSGPARLAAAPLRAAVSQVARLGQLVVNEVRVDVDRKILGSTAWNLGVTLGFSAFVLLAAIALIMNLVTALAQERRPRLAVLRALGLSRAGLVALSVLEGAAYSLIAAAMGLALGVAAGLYLGLEIWNAAVGDPTDTIFDGVPLQIAIRPGTVVLAFAAGALVTLTTVTAAAYRTSRMAIASAVRDLPEPAPVSSGGWRRSAVIGAALVAGGALVVPSDLKFRLIGGVLLIAGITAFSRGRLSDRARYSLSGLLLTAWVTIDAASSKFLSDLVTLLFLFAVGVPIMAVGLTVSAVANLRLIDEAVGRLGNGFGRLQATLRPPLAYLSRRPLRTGLGTSAFALVLVMVTLVAVVVASTNIDYARDSAGYDIQIVTQSSESLVLPAAVERQITSQVSIPTRVYQGPLDTSDFGGGGASVALRFYVLPMEPQDWGPVTLSDREKRFASDDEVWRAIRAETGLFVGEWGGGVAPGTTVAVQGNSSMLNLRLGGVSASTILDGFIVSPFTVAEIPTRPAGSTTLLRTRPGTDNRTLAHDIERALFAQGVQATTTQEILRQDYETSVNYVVEYDVLLHMGLVVAVLALAMVSIRAAVERRRTIGIQRALGYTPSRVMTGMFVEAAITTTIGALSGVVAGLLIGYVVDKAQTNTTFAIDGFRLGLALAIVYGTVFVVIFPIANRVSRLAPTDAIRAVG